MKSAILVLMLAIASTAVADWPGGLGAVELDQVGQIDLGNAPTRVMGLYEQGFLEGAKVGDSNAGKIGWFFAGFGNLPLLWLPWTVETRRPAKPPIQAEEEFNKLKKTKKPLKNGWMER